jgi:hypothetical protein
VADLVEQGTVVGSMLCPSNPAEGSIILNDLVGFVPEGNCVDYLGSPPMQTWRAR